MRRLQIRDIISDNDGTLTTFPSWYAPAMLAAMARIAPVLGVSVVELMREFKRVFDKAGTHECAFPFVGAYFASLWKGTHEQFVERVTGPFFETYDATRARYLEPYPGAIESLKEAKRLGINVDVLTDAPLYATLSKLHLAGVLDGVRGVYAMQLTFPDQSEIWNPLDYAYCLERYQRSLRLTSELGARRAHELPLTAVKPDATGAKLIVEHHRLDPERTAVIGDSHPRDGGVAHALGMFYVFARYGAYDFVPPQYREVLEGLLSWGTVPAKPLPPPPIGLTVATYHGIIPVLHRYRRKALLQAA